MKDSHLRNIFENHHTVMLVIDPADGRIIDANPKAEDFYGWSHEKLLTMRITEINTASPEQIQAEMAHAQAEQRNQFFFQHRLASGMTRDVEIFSGPIEMDGRTLLYSIIHDITARRKTERALAERETVFRQLTEQVPAIIYRASLDELSQTIYISPRISELGYTPDEWLSSPDIWIRSIHPDDLDTVEWDLEQFRHIGGELRLEYRLRDRAGKWRHYQDMGQIVHDAEGKPLYLQGVMIDITAQKQLESSLSQLAQRSLYLIELPRLADESTESEFMQRGLEMAEQLTRSEISFIHFVNDDEDSIELVTWSSRTLANYCHAAFDRHYPVSQAGVWAEAVRQHQPMVFNDYATTANRRGLPEGHAHLQRLISLPVIEHGKVVMLAGVGNKATDYVEEDVQTLQLIANEIWSLVRRGRTQRQLARFSRLVERSTNEFYSFDAETLHFVDANHGACRNIGYSLDELRQMTPLDLKPELTREEFDRMLEPLKRGAVKIVAFSTVHRRKNGSTYPVEVHLENNEDANPLFLATVRDMTERRRSEQVLREALEQQRELNRKIEAAQGQLLQSEKMASIGQLAAGVAHEINNPIGFVNSNIGSLDHYVADLFAIADAYGVADAAAPGEWPELAHARAVRQQKDFDFLRTDIPQLLAESRDGLARVAKIVKDLKDFSRAGEAHMQWADLHQGLDSTLNIVWNELKYKCEVNKEYGTLPQVWCEPSQINQVFMNMLVNAGHAIEQRGVITIRTGQQGGQVFVSITDTGKGIPPENLNRLFEPFFTTKPVGKGTGLGLSLAYGIVQKHGGRIDVQSEVGQGATFTVRLPIKPANDEEPAVSIER